MHTGLQRKKSDAGPRCSWRAKHVYLSIPPVCSLHSSILLSYVGHMSAQVIQHAGLTLAGWVANDVTPPGKRHAEYMTTLTRMIPAPLLGEIPWLAENPENAATGKYINLALL